MQGKPWPLFPDTVYFAVPMCIGYSGVLVTLTLPGLVIRILAGM